MFTDRTQQQAKETGGHLREALAISGVPSAFGMGGFWSVLRGISSGFSAAASLPVEDRRFTM